AARPAVAAAVETAGTTASTPAGSATLSPSAPPGGVGRHAAPGWQPRGVPDAPGDDGQAAAASAGEAEAAQSLSQVRRITAARMAESAHTVAPVTLTTEADATRLVELRAQIRADVDALGIVAPPLSYNELLVKLLAVALAEQPALNASWRDGRVVQHPDVHIGVAVDTDRGLLVPVVRDARNKSVATISRELQTMISAAQAGALSVDQLKGGTFTLTNLGMYDIDAFTPIINLPECAILGVGRIVPRPVVVDVQAETVRVRRMLALSLTFDHRVVDGGPAARFLQRVKQLVEHPGAWVTR
ncbi:MAG: 2-oxo acid dehydrogenase subunit E2, partial [Chloroflexi bacterium]|nr:2-oxo acid dehydrogenase subunit E2 [Chloroflexota bacterium]